MEEDRREAETPYRFQLKTEEPFASVGIWEENEDEDGQKIETFAIITQKQMSECSKYIPECR